MSLASVLIIGFVVLSIFSTGSDQRKVYRRRFSPNVKVVQQSNRNTYVASVRNVTQTPKVKEPALPKYNTGKITYAGDDNYQVISSYIIGFYTKVPINEAEEIAENIVKYSLVHKVDPKFVTALIARESSFNKNAVSVTNARGLGQIKDFNYKPLGIKDPFSIRDNVRGCVNYITQMLNKWNGNPRRYQLALASYSEGYGAVSRSGGRYKNSTARYVNDIMEIYSFLQSAH